MEEYDLKEVCGRTIKPKVYLATDIIVDDFQNVIPILKEKTKEMK